LFWGFSFDTIVVHDQLTMNTSTRDATVCAGGSLELKPTKQPAEAT